MGQHNLRIFIAEDEPIALQGFKAIISSMGHTVIGSATDGRSAVKGILELKPNLVIIDINMPGMDGLEAIEAVNQDILIPYIVVTGYQEQELLERASRLGVFAYLPKPVDEYEMRSAIEIAMARFSEFGQLKKELGDTKTALQERKLIEQAKGILMEKARISEPQAMRHLQKMARNKNKKLVVVAKEIIQANSLFDI